MSINKSKILPVVTLFDIFGKDFILNSRASSSDYRWLPKNLDFLTGPPLTIAGNMPVICSYSVAAEDVITLMKSANLEVNPILHVYRSYKEYRDLAAYFLSQKKKIVFNYPHPSSEFNKEGYWIDPKLVKFLNNKANLERLVPKEHVPKRIIVHPSEIIKTANKFNKLPLVIKAATDQPTGGGCDVIICKDRNDINNAWDYFQTCSTVVLEEYIEINQNYNLQFAKTINHQIIYLGASQQISNPTGHYLGNWLVKNNEPPGLLIQLGRLIMERACSLGFMGIVGFDIVISKENRVLAIDLNFRINGSTPALLLKESIFKIHNASVLLSRSWKPNMNWNKFKLTCQNAIESGYLIPISIYNPLVDSNSHSIPHISGILIGSSKEDILKKERLLGFS
ncbi:hypothetical protein [Candidatus Contubernalis alkaliaceticus]|uniref:hypothetical protein n=1 Tax=Candidatus Contubernalis alkaliaceticus TaxID=338645 RepID=UPI001F4BDE8A|nr:hypothetical protein [Candidatus Contubernalis alkalaceticus]UNC92230.1 hypothetical protein HUE98_09080 [Candidatus Contubernalis alkalaceticus]